MESVHENFQIFDSGLWINKDFPYFGASPDGIVSCDCCGIGLCEIKCPFCHKDSMLDSLSSKNNSCLVDGPLGPALDHRHAYFYQLLGKWYTRPSTPPTQLHGDEELVDDVDGDEEEGPWCYCHTDIEGSNLIGCDNPECAIQWFHNYGLSQTGCCTKRKMVLSNLLEK
ncbi:uncharacterized protein [Montipora foliosa]|uniref:uncharacterized protein isoform X3 n=1 Tax=Montipora foliosa TaxID=591990 RepID=UPI0035F1CE38